MKNRMLSLALICLTFFAFQSPKPSLIGTWKNTSLTVTMKLDNGQDSVLQVPEGKWEQVLKMKPIMTTFEEDGRFKSEYYGLYGNHLGTEAGTWVMRCDSLILNSSGYDNAYHVSYEGDKSRFVSLLDFDKDGKKDDLYEGWQIRVKKD